MFIRKVLKVLVIKRAAKCNNATLMKRHYYTRHYHNKSYIILVVKKQCVKLFCHRFWKISIVIQLTEPAKAYVIRQLVSSWCWIWTPRLFFSSV